MRVMWDLDCRGEGRRGGFGAVRLRCGSCSGFVWFCIYSCKTHGSRMDREPVPYLDRILCNSCGIAI